MSSANDGMIEPLLDLQRLAAGIRWRRRMWGALALVGLLGGILAAVVLPGKATASAQVYVVHKTEDSGDPTATTKTDLALLKSTTVAGEAIARGPVDEPAEDYVEEYSGEVVAANVLKVTAPGADRDLAVANARALADAFVAVYVKQSDERARAEVRALDDRRLATQRELAALGATSDESGRPGLDTATRAERVAGLNAQLSAIEQLAVQAEIGTPRIASGTMVIDTARVTSRSTLVNAVLYGAIGLLLGFGMGIGLAAVLTVARDRPVLRRDIGAHLGASVIAQVPAPVVRRLSLRRRGRAHSEYERVAGILTRLVRHGGPVSLLELESRPATVELARLMADDLAGDGPVQLVDDLPAGGLDQMPDNATGAVRVVSGAEFPTVPSDGNGTAARRLGVGTVGPGASWTDLRRLGDETIIIVRAGASEASWLHTVARQLADEGIAVIGVVVVHPDPRDRSDGTLWDPLHTAVRGRRSARPGSLGGAAPPAHVALVGDRLTVPVYARAGEDSGEPANGGEGSTLNLRTLSPPRTVMNGNGHGTAHGGGGVRSGPAGGDGVVEDSDAGGHGVNRVATGGTADDGGVPPAGAGSDGSTDSSADADGGSAPSGTAKAEGRRRGANRGGAANRRGKNTAPVHGTANHTAAPKQAPSDHARPKGDG